MMHLLWTLAALTVVAIVSWQVGRLADTMRLPRLTGYLAMGALAGPATVLVEVRPVNDPPVAVDDAATTPEDTPVTVDVLANDVDVEGLDPTSVVITQAPANGTAQVDPDTGAITYAPAPDFAGEDALAYTVRDAEGALAGALGKLNVVMEAYPELTGNENMMQVSEELTSTENKVAFSRQAYNDAVTTYNTARLSFPAVLIAGAIGHASDAALLEFADSAAIQEAPKVSFS